MSEITRYAIRIRPNGAAELIPDECASQLAGERDRFKAEIDSMWRKSAETVHALYTAEGEASRLRAENAALESKLTQARASLQDAVDSVRAYGAPRHAGTSRIYSPQIGEAQVERWDAVLKETM